MKANWKSLLFLITVVVVGALFFAFLWGQKQDKKSLSTAGKTNAGVVAGSTTEENGYVERLAKDMRDKGMVFYGSYQSQDSNDQKSLFGSAAKYLDYVECDATGENANPDECISMKVEVYPTWVYQGKAYSGKKTLAELAQIVAFSE